MSYNAHDVQSLGEYYGISLAEAKSMLEKQEIDEKLDVYMGEVDLHSSNGEYEKAFESLSYVIDILRNRR